MGGSLVLPGQTDYQAASDGGRLVLPSDPQAAIRQKYGLPDSVDLSKDISHPANAAYVNPPAQYPKVSGFGGRMADPRDVKLKGERLANFQRGYQEFNPPPPQPKGFWANVWGEAKNLMTGATSEPAGVMGEGDFPLMGSPAADTGQHLIRSGQNLASGNLRSAAREAVESVPTLGPAAVERYHQFREDPWGAVGATLTDVATEEALRRSPEIVDRGRRVMEQGRDLVARDVANRTLPQTKAQMKADIAHGKDAATAVVKEKVRNSAQAQAQMDKVGQSIDQALTNATGNTVSIEPIVDAAYRKAVQLATRKGEPGAIARLDSVRDAFKTQYGSLDKSPRAAAEMYRQIRNDFGFRYGADEERQIVRQFAQDVADGMSREVRKRAPAAGPLMDRYGDLAVARDSMGDRELSLSKKDVIRATASGAKDWGARRAAQAIGRQYEPLSLAAPQRIAPNAAGAPGASGPAGPALPPAPATGPGPRPAQGWVETPELNAPQPAQPARIAPGAGELPPATPARIPGPAGELPAANNPRLLEEPGPSGPVIKLTGETPRVSERFPIIPGERPALPWGAEPTPPENKIRTVGGPHSLEFTADMGGKAPADLSQDEMRQAYRNRGENWDKMNRAQKEWARKEAAATARSSPEGMERTAREGSRDAEENSRRERTATKVSNLGLKRIASMAEARLAKLGYTTERFGYGNLKSKQFQADSIYVRVLGEDGDELGIVRISGHPEAEGGGYSFEKGERHGRSTVSIDPRSGKWMEDLDKEFPQR